MNCQNINHLSRDLEMKKMHSEKIVDSRKTKAYPRDCSSAKSGQCSSYKKQLNATKT